ncbi:progestin and adipoQ receptor family member 4 [Microplitis mediator]|uniref:progestin and adipoQ receptor family member 4 n=1 Tax=Microplitis mediator TaxID=375433 RepID=UPI0025533C6C|nr:progestin and adipoQ receptor family member 4 [Microplitis mediator]
MRLKKSISAVLNNNHNQPPPAPAAAAPPPHRPLARSSGSDLSTLLSGHPRNADVRTELAGEVTELIAANFVANNELDYNKLSAITASTDDHDNINDKADVSCTKTYDDKDNWCLQTWSDMPSHLQFNPHIRTGYRQITNLKGCLRSLFYIHNETVNTFTHGLAVLHILLTIPDLLPWWEKGVFFGFISWCHLIGAVSPWIGSFIYHLFMNLDYGEKFYKGLLKLDMLGIWVCQSIGALPMIATSVHCLTPILWYSTMLLYVFLSIWGLFKAMRAKSPWERRLCFAPPFMMRMIFLTLRCFHLTGGDPDNLTHIVLQDLVAVIGGAIGALRIPEKWLPGQVDFIFNSHNIMHVIVVCAVWSMHTATIRDIKWMMIPNVCLESSNSSPAFVHNEL